MTQQVLRPITVVVIEPDALAQQALRMLFEGTGIQLLEVCNSTAIAINTIELAAPNVVILDLDLGSPNWGSTLVQIRDIRKASPTSACLVLTASSPQANVVDDVIWAGADGCHSKGFLTRTLLVAIVQDLAAGQTEISQVLAQKLLNASRNNAEALESGAGPKLQLTNAERDVLKMKAMGQKITQIADDLKISVASTKRIFYNIVSRMHDNASQLK